MAIDITGKCSFDTLIADKFNKLGVLNKLSKKEEDAAALAASATQASWIGDTPLTQQLVSGATELVGAVAANFTSQLGQAIINKVGTLYTGKLLAIVSVLSTLGGQLELALAGMYIDQLKTEVSTRIAMYILLQRYYSRIQSLLFILRSPKRADISRLYLALRYVEEAQRNLLALQVSDSQPTRLEYTLFKRGFLYIDMAIRVLSSADDELAANVATFGVDALSTLESLDQVDNKTQLENRAKKLRKALADRLAAEILAKTAFIIDSLSWHLAQISTLLLTTAPVLTYTGGPSSYISSLLASPSEYIFDSEKESLLLDEFKQNYIYCLRQKEKVSEDGTLKQMVNVINEASLKKGIIPTNIVIDGLSGTLLELPFYSSSIGEVSNYLLMALSPVIDILDSVKTDISATIESEASDITIAAKQVKWIMQLTVAKGFQKTLSDAFKAQDELTSAQTAYQEILNYLQEHKEDTLNGDIVDNILPSVLIIAEAPFGYQALTEAMVMTKMVLRQLNTAINENYNFLDILNTFDSDNIPAVQSFKKVMGDLAKDTSGSSDVPSIAQALVSGDLSAGIGALVAIAGVAAGLYKGAKNMLDSGAFKACTNEASKDALVDKQQKLQQTREKLIEERAKVSNTSTTTTVATINPFSDIHVGIQPDGTF